MEVNIIQLRQLQRVHGLLRCIRDGVKEIKCIREVDLEECTADLAELIKFAQIKP